MRRFAICGNPVLHSQSPRIFNRLFSQQKIKAHYTRLAVDSAVQAVSFFKQLGLSGMNVTAPFKKEIIPLMDEVDEAVRSIGAVNTVVACQNRLKGLNTDFLGVSGGLEVNEVDVTGQSCAVVGAGGAARAAVFALLKGGGNVTVVNRTFNKADSLARSMGCQAAPIEDLAMVVAQSKVIVSTVAAGVKILDARWLTAEQVVLDANYVRPCMSDANQQVVCPVIDGHHWLVHQAVGVVKHFIGRQVNAEQLMHILHQGSDFDHNANLLLLAEFPGSGAMARHLSSMMGCPCTDLHKHPPEPGGMSESSAINGRKQVFYLNVSQMAADLTAYLTHLPPVIVVGVLEICQGKHSAYHLLDLVIDSADDEETAAERIYHEYQHIQ